MYRLFYMSTARPDLDKAEVNRMVAAAALKNALLNITGAIGYDGERFAQIIEGDKDDVTSLMETISADDRHSGIVIMAEKPVERRSHEGWGMKHMDSLIFDDFESAMADA